MTLTDYIRKHSLLLEKIEIAAGMPHKSLSKAKVEGGRPIPLKYIPGLLKALKIEAANSLKEANQKIRDLKLLK